MTWVLAVTSPFMWTFKDLSVSLRHDPETRSGLTPQWRFWLKVWCFGSWDSQVVRICCRSFCRVTRAKPQNIYLEILKNSLVLFACACVHVILFAFYVACAFAGNFRTLVNAAVVRKWGCPVVALRCFTGNSFSRHRKPSLGSALDQPLKKGASTSRRPKGQSVGRFFFLGGF